MAETAKANAGFGAALAAGVKAGKIDSKEKAALDVKHSALMKKEAAANADGKFTAAECNRILADIKAKHAALDKAAASAPAKPAAPAASARK
ncbi:MAG: hypothetical protein WCK94_07575 [Comamonadaceae bacterium]